MLDLDHSLSLQLWLCPVDSVCKDGQVLKDSSPLDVTRLKKKEDSNTSRASPKTMEEEQQALFWLWLPKIIIIEVETHR